MRLFLLLPLLLLMAACAPARPVLPPPPPASGEALLRQLETFAGAFHSLRGVAKVRVESDGRSLSGTQVLLAQKPDLLRAETLSPFGNPVLTVAAGAGRLNVLVPGEGRFLAGEASYQNMQRFTRLPLQLADLVGLLLYQVPIIPPGAPQISAEEDGRQRLILAAEEGVRQEALFDRELRLVETAYFQGEELVLKVGYGEFGEDGFPRFISLETPAEKTEARVTFSEVEVNVPLPEERFRLTPPSGYQIEPLP